MRAASCCLAAVAVLAGCGGSGGSIDRGQLEQEIQRQTDAEAGVGSVESVQCVKDGDGFHFACLVTGTDGTLLSLTATCDTSGGGTCVWKPT